MGNILRAFTEMIKTKAMTVYCFHTQADMSSAWRTQMTQKVRVWSRKRIITRVRHG